MTRTALARQYRPRRFGEVTMQEHVSETLKTAVARGRVAHAYLFCGPRGVGKTTAARVLAMALNCPQRGDDGEPCGTCESCDRIWAGRTSFDVVEIDAASNRGVEDARELRERAMYAPTGADRYKVYIIDEAHMLTREAWNALLKILEEPPPRVIFVFATTEPQKIQQSAPPILSRCQRFDFRRISVAGIVARLEQVLSQEGIEAGAGALVPIARRAEGGLRDALSLLDQVLSFAGRRLTADDVRRVLGLIAEELYLELFDILADHRHGEVFRFVERLLDEGYDVAEFYRGLADALRALLVAKLDGPQAPAVRDDLRQGYAERATRFGTGDLLRMLAHVAELDTEGRLRKSVSPRVQLEAMLLRFAYLDRTVELEELLRAMTGATGDTGTRGHGDAGMPDAGTRGRGDTGTRGHGDTGTRRHGDTEIPASPRPAVPASGGGSPEDALRDVVDHPEELPRGLSAFLKAAQLSEAQGGELVLELPPGPGLERLLSDERARRAVEQALQRRLGEARRLEVRLQLLGGEAAARLTPERVKNEQLARLAREEPVLGRVVEEWDLELKD